MKRKCSLSLHKVLPILLCVLLFICTIPPIAFADDAGFESGGGSTRGGGVGRFREALSAADASAVRSGDLICNSCGAEYHSDETLDTDFKCPTCGDYFFSVNKVMLTCWRCNKTTIFSIDDISSMSFCSHCGAYISSIVSQGDKTGYAFKAGGGSTRGGGVGRKHDGSGIVLDGPDIDSESLSPHWPSDATDLDTWNKGHGMIRMEHAFTFPYYWGVDSNSGYWLSADSQVSCEHLDPNSDLFKKYVASLRTDFEIADHYPDSFNEYFPTSYSCNEDYIGVTTYPSLHFPIHSVFYYIAPSDGYYWVSHYPYGQTYKRLGYESYNYVNITTASDNIITKLSAVGSDVSTAIVDAISDLKNFLKFKFPDYTPISGASQVDIIPNMGGATMLNDSHGHWEVSGSSYYDWYRNPKYAFDRDLSTAFATSNFGHPIYLQVKIPDPESYFVGGYTFTVWNDYYPTSWTFQGSIDGNTWIDLDKGDSTSNSLSKTNHFKIVMQNCYSYYRICFTGVIQLGISEFNITGYNSSDVVEGSFGSSGSSDNSGIIAILEQIRDKMVDGFSTITTNITTLVTDFQTAVVSGFADLSANFQLAIENLSVNITNIFNKKFEDLPDVSPSPSPSPDPSEPTPSPAPTEPPTPTIPDTQKYIIPTMTANNFTDSHGTWIASGSSYAENRFTYFNAFNPDGFWVNGLGSPSGAHGREMPCYLQIEIPDPKNYYVDGYMIKCGPDDNFDTWQILGSNDAETWETLDSKSASLADDDEHKYPVTLHKAYKYYRLYIEHFSDYMGVKQFNLLGYDAADVTIPDPTPTPDPDTPNETPTPTPAPTDTPDSGNKNNFWTIIFPSHNDDGTEDGHKGIFWALISLILALIAFFSSLAAGVGYLFPFLPDGVVMTINTCLFVAFLFVIIKFIMRSK